MNNTEIKEVEHTKCGRCRCHRANNLFLNDKGRRLKTCSTCRAPKFSCNLCEYKSLTNMNLSKHKKAIHDKIKDVLCDKCEYKCATRRSLLMHNRYIHDKIRDFECDKCDYKCSAKGDLSKHQKIVHDKIKDFVCNLCDYKCSTNSHILTHKRAVHDKIKDSQCNKCDFKCSTNGGLLAHQKAIHDKIRDFECDLCDYKCSQRCNLIAHKRICTGKINCSAGELKCRLALEKLKINYETEVTFANCRSDKGILRFDFYLPELNKLIEFDGQAHFKPVCFGGVSQERAEANFQRRLKHDKIKNNYCKKNKIDLLRISYTDFDDVYDYIEAFS